MADPLSGTLALPLWTVGALTAVLIVVGAMIYSHAGRDGLEGALARVGLLLVGAVVSWLLLASTIRQDFAAERRSLEMRAAALAAPVTAPGSPLACLDAVAGDTVEDACERDVFASPATTAAALAHVAAQLTLFNDIAAFARRSGADTERLAGGLRRALESDRFGLVARVLAVHDGCTAQQCPALALMRDPRRINTNLAQRTYDGRVSRHAAAWRTGGPAAVAQSSQHEPSPEVAAAADAPAHPTHRPPGPDVFFPTAASIPPVHIMTAEPPRSEPETTGAAPARTPPRRRPSTASKQAAPAPMDLSSHGRPPAAH